METFKILRVKKQQFGRIFGKKAVFGLGILRRAARQNFYPFKLTHFPPFKWFFQGVLFIGISNLVGEALKSDFLFLFLDRSYNSAQASTLGELFSRFMPVDPPTNEKYVFEVRFILQNLNKTCLRSV